MTFERREAVVEQQTKENVTKKSTWVRFLYMVLFAVIFNIAEFVILVVVTVQFITKLFTGDVHERLQEFGDSLALYVADVVRYLTYTTEDLPYPFGDWPDGDQDKPQGGSRRKRARKKAAKSEAADTPAPSPSSPPSGGTGGVGGTDIPPGSASG